jgi:glycosyltransferase involved in cell wall biosynthesis
MLSCIVPARNEEGHLLQVIEMVLSVPEISEVVIVEGGSQDKTWEVAELINLKYPNRVSIVRQENTGKFDAVLKGAHYCTSDLVMIWDADGTVPLEDTRNIINAALEFNCASMGDRLRGHIEKGAMQKANWFGNWFFAVLWVPILRRKPSDLLCGTKIFSKEIFVDMPQWLINADPYGDFALIAHARYNKIEIKSIPVNYLARSYGATNISRWSGGLSLLKITLQIYLRIWAKTFLKR